ncbi:tyrosine-type recombinase/integrase [Salmonella enterica]|nr:tyrosine-type recombinase/integrase [Salmonella enterica subsp. enterica serovar Oslo]EHW8352250.1 tyrosine-type recombinase/integrase [Salmonella enterica]EHW8353116.1 tyrosine-type recombinase/integrase [Salmonella enterica]
MRKYITLNEWDSFFSAIKGSSTECRDKALFKLAYKHGLRVSELINIQVSDIDLKESTIFVKRLKNGFSTIHPLQKKTSDLLKKWMKKRTEYLIKKQKSDYLFLSVTGHPLSRQWIFKLSRRYGEAAGLSLKLHPHMLRHACGYALANQGLDTRLIQDYLGHKNIHHTVLYTASNAGRFYKVWRK